MRKVKLFKTAILVAAAVFACSGLHAQSRTAAIKGQVLDATTGESVIGAGVLVKGTDQGVSTDYDGYFSIDVAPGTVLVVSSLGYQTAEVTAAQGIQVLLQADYTTLDDVVVIGYGTAHKKDLTGSVVQIRPESLSNESPATVQDILRGTAGLSVGLNNSAKGGGSLNIRGQRSVYTSGSHNEPLIILDGMQFYGELSEINPDNIAQIDILKDASSAAVYGAKAANGVIIITTKKGRSDVPTISFTSNFGFTGRADYQRYFTPDEYIQHKADYYEADTYSMTDSGEWLPYQKGQTNYGYYRNPDNLPAGVSLEQWRNYTVNGNQSDLEIWLRRINFKGNVLENAIAGNVIDWDDYVYRTGFQQDYNVNVGGSTNKSNYFLSAGYVNNQGVTYGDDYQAIRLATKLNMDVKNWLTIGATVNFQNRSDGRNLNPTDMVNYSPFASDKDADGKWLQYIEDSPEYTQRPTSPYFTSQYSELERGYTVLNSQFNITAKLPFNFTYQFNISPRMQWYYNRQFLSADLPDSLPKDRGVNRSSSKRFDWSLNNILTWQKTFADVHNLTLTLVQEAEERKYWSDEINARDILPTDALGFHNITGAVMNESSFKVTDTHETADALLARMQYVYDDRYLLTTSVRRDGYCAFGANYPYAVFPAVALGWVFTNEHFWKWNDVMDYGKLRFSWGKNGNRSLADPYLALSNLTTGQYVSYYYGGTTNYETYLRVDRLGNPNLQWEKSTAYDLGLDFSFLKGRISGALDFYLTQTKDMIMDQRLPSFSGFDHITTNLGQVNNSGVEFSLNTINVDTRNFKWNTSLTFSYNKNRIVHLYGESDENGEEESDRTNQWFIGHAIDEIWDYEIIGIWQVNESAEAARYGQYPGDPKIYNNPANDIVNADGSTSPYYDDDDKVFLGQRTAPYRVSMRNEMTIGKNISVGFNVYGLFGWKASQDAFNYDRYLNVDNGGGFLEFKMQNQPWKQYWTLDNQTTEFARINAIGSGGANHPHKYFNRSFLRIDNISVAYNIPSTIVRKINISALKVYANVKNLYDFHAREWTYGDPEIMSYSPRTFNIGFNITF